MGRGDLNRDEIAKLMTVSVRGEGECNDFILLLEFGYHLLCYKPNYKTVTHNDALPPPPFSTAYQRDSKKGRYYY